MPISRLLQNLSMGPEETAPSHDGLRTCIAHNRSRGSQRSARRNDRQKRSSRSGKPASKTQQKFPPWRSRNSASEIAFRQLKPDARIGVGRNGRQGTASQSRESAGRRDAQYGNTDRVLRPFGIHIVNAASDWRGVIVGAVRGAAIDECSKARPARAPNSMRIGPPDWRPFSGTRSKFETRSRVGTKWAGAGRIARQTETFPARANLPFEASGLRNVRGTSWIPYRQATSSSRSPS